MIIGITITGRIGSGKGELSKYLEAEGFNQLAYGEEVRKEASLLKIEPTRQNLQELGYKLREQNKECFWTLKLIERIEREKNYVVDGFRYPDQVKLFIHKYDENFNLIGTDAKEEIRYERLKNRAREGDPRTLDEFFIQDGRDWIGYLEGLGQNTRGCFEMISNRIHNNSSLEDFRKRISEVLEDLSLC